MTTRIDRYFIVAGNHAEYRTWVKKNHSRFPHINLQDFVCVSNSLVLRGYRNPHGFFIGTYQQRPDIYEIATVIFLCSPGLDKQEFWNKVLPPAKPKLDTKPNDQKTI